MALRQQGLTSFLKGSSSKKHQSTENHQFQLHAKRRKSFGRHESRFGTCPLCNANLAFHVLQSHAEMCTGPSSEENSAANKQKGSKVGVFSRRSLDEEEKSRFEACPICNVRFPVHLLNSHAQDCAGSEKECSSTSRSESKSLSDESSVMERDSADERSSDETLESPPQESTPWWKLAKQHATRATRIDNPIQPSSEPIPGLYLFENFITEKEEATIIAELDGTCPDNRHEFLPWKQSSFNGSSKGKRWGVHCNLRDRKVSAPEHTMPHFFHAILKPKLEQITSMMGCIPNEANAIDYRRKEGHWLKSHVDDRQLSKEPIANLSIAGDCIMTFRNERVPGRDKVRVLLRRRTLQVLTGKARYDYSHGIANQDLISDRRVSVTLRESPLTKVTKQS